MPYSHSNAFKVFISYASEDETIAEVLAKTLRAAFVNAIEITMMSEFPSGLNWRQFIDKSIIQTDVLIAIATGRLKASHSFTGTEIGSFSFSMSLSPKMTKFNDLDRRMIPFAVLARVPDTINEFEGIDIEPTSLRDVRFNAANLARDLQNLSGDDSKDGPDKMIFKLLGDFEDLINQVRPATSGGPSRTIIEDQRLGILRDHARALYKEILELMLSREKSVVNPKAKLIIRTQSASSNGGEYEAIEKAIIRVEGNCFDVFGLSEISTAPFSWAALTSMAESDIVFQWRKALASLISSSQASKFLDDNSIISFNRKKLFRIFTSRVTEYYSGEVEFDVFIIEILPQKDYGDPDTTLLLKAMEVGLGYRFMFLEETSEFSPVLFSATKLESLQARVSEMIERLNLLLLKSDEYKLNDPRSIIKILGVTASGDIDEKYKTWDREKLTIYKSAKTLMEGKEITYADKAEFIKVISSFCDHTRELNRTYTAAVLRGLDSEMFSVRKPIGVSRIRTPKGPSSKVQRKSAKGARFSLGA